MNKTAKAKWENENCFKYAKNHTVSTYSISIDDYDILYSIIKNRFIKNNTSNLLNWLHSERIYQNQNSTFTTNHSELELLTINISFEIDSAKEQTSCNLEPFKAIPIDDSNEDFDAYINAGGPIWATCFASSNNDDLNNNLNQTTIERKLVVGVSRVGYDMRNNEKQPYNCDIGSDSIHILGKPECYNNLLQIWNIKAMNLHLKSYNNNDNFKKNITKVKTTKLGRPRKEPIVKIAKRKGRPLKYPKENQSELKISKKITSNKSITSKLSKKEMKLNSELIDNKKDNEHIKISELDFNINNECIIEQINNVDTEDIKNDNLHYDHKMEVDERIITNVDNNINKDLEITLSYCISLNKRGPTWGCSWAPIKHLEAFYVDRSHPYNPLGLLAAVCGDGSCIVLLLPSGYTKSVNNNAEEEEDRYVDIPVYSEDQVLLCELGVDKGHREHTTTTTSTTTTNTTNTSNVVMITCVAWNTHVPYQLCCGMSDGSVTIWSIASFITHDTECIDRKLSIPLLTLIDPSIDEHVTSMSAISTVQYCPYDKNLILCTGYYGVSIWNIMDNIIPVYDHKQVCANLCGKWDPFGFGFYRGDSETTTLGWDPLWSSSFDIHRQTLYQHVYKYGGIWDLLAMKLITNDTLLITIASDGTVRCSIASNLIGCKSKTIVINLFQMLLKTSNNNNNNSVGNNNNNNNNSVGNNNNNNNNSVSNNNNNNNNSVSNNNNNSVSNNNNNNNSVGNNGNNNNSVSNNGNNNNSVSNNNNNNNSVGNNGNNNNSVSNNNNNNNSVSNNNNNNNSVGNNNNNNNNSVSNNGNNNNSVSNNNNQLHTNINQDSSNVNSISYDNNTINNNSNMSIHCINYFKAQTNLLCQIDDVIPNSRVSLHCLDALDLTYCINNNNNNDNSINPIQSLTINKSNNPILLIVYGGAAGILRIHSFNPIQAFS